jgi:hypothetical protein
VRPRAGKTNTSCWNPCFATQELIDGALFAPGELNLHAVWAPMAFATNRSLPCPCLPGRDLLPQEFKVIGISTLVCPDLHVVNFVGPFTGAR